MPRRAEVHIRFGAPVRLPDASMSNQEGADWIMERIADLLPERYRGIYGREDAAVTAAAP